MMDLTVLVLGIAIVHDSACAWHCHHGLDLVIAIGPQQRQVSLTLCIVIASTELALPGIVLGRAHTGRKGHGRPGAVS